MYAPFEILSLSIEYEKLVERKFGRKKKLPKKIGRNKIVISFLYHDKNFSGCWWKILSCTCRV